ncbi:hypothetical protein A9Q81_09665 [Gammaproteobacteria bacterium 42_54_T18]|nr:hypothetical protein A9Q81_09665 [Gammaproteobacteria bacterium 42_54_T18]
MKQLLFSTILSVILSFNLSTISSNAWALAPDIEADRLVLAGKSKIAAKDFAAARAYLDRVEPLGIKPSNEFHWLLGQVLFHEGQYHDAKTRIERYVENGDKTSEYYESALLMLTDIETQLADSKALVATKEKTREFAKQWEEKVSLSDSKPGDAFDAKVNALYLGENLTASLVSHINDLLRSFVFIEGKVKNTNIADHVQYAVSVSSSGDILTTKKDVKVGKNKAASSINVSRLNAFGVNPIVTYRCSKVTDSCTVLNPVDGVGWIQVAKDDAVAKELAKAFGRLIKSIQRG